MLDLLLEILYLLIDPFSPFRERSFRSFSIAFGLSAILVGALLLVGRSKGSGVVIPVLFIAAGAALTLAGITLWVREGAAGKRGTRPPPDNWTPPDAEDVKKLLGGR